MSRSSFICKCMMCGEQYSTVSCESRDVQNKLIQYILQPGGLETLHACKDGSTGIANLIGCKVLEEEELPRDQPKCAAHTTVKDQGLSEESILTLMSILSERDGVVYVSLTTLRLSRPVVCLKAVSGEQKVVSIDTAKQILKESTYV